MLSAAYRELIRNASPPIGNPLTAELVPESFKKFGIAGNDLLSVLFEHNGCFAFNDALHVFHIGKTKDSFDIETWNNPETWKREFASDMSDILFFAQDIHGEQFGIDSGEKAIIRFDPELGTTTRIANSIEDWIRIILNDPTAELGQNMANQWLQKHGPIPRGGRLVPVIPLVFKEGRYDIDNMMCVKSLEGMKYRAKIANAIKDIPEGTKVSIKIVE